MSTDPIGFEGGDVNWYSYGGNNPLQRFDVFGLVPYPKRVEERLREDFVPFVEQYTSKRFPFFRELSPSCIQLYQAAILKFIADEYETRGIVDIFQDGLVAGGVIPIPLTRDALYQIIDPAWKRDVWYKKYGMRLHPAYNDVGPANIEVKSALLLAGKDPATASATTYLETAQVLVTDRGTVLYASQFVRQAIEDLKGHFESRCCRYDRRSVELIVNYLRTGREQYWANTWEKFDRFLLLTPEEFEEWKKSPPLYFPPLLDILENPKEYEGIIMPPPALFPFEYAEQKNRVRSLSPGNIDGDRFQLIEELTQWW